MPHDRLPRGARLPRRSRLVRHDRSHRVALARGDHHVLRGDGRSAERRAGHPRHGYQRQGFDGPDDLAAAGGVGPDGRHLHQPAPGTRQRADLPQRRADPRRGVGRADRRDRRPRAARRHPPELLRDPHGVGVPLVRRRGGRRMVLEVGLLGRWDATNVADRRRRGRHQHRDGPHRVRRPDARRHRPREGRHHQADVGGDRRGDRSGTGRHLRRCRCRDHARPRHRLRDDEQPPRGRWSPARPPHADDDLSRRLPAVARRAPGRQRRSWR